MLFWYFFSVLNKQNNAKYVWWHLLFDHSIYHHLVWIIYTNKMGKLNYKSKKQTAYQWRVIKPIKKVLIRKWMWEFLIRKRIWYVGYVNFSTWDTASTYNTNHKVQSVFSFMSKMRLSLVRIIDTTIAMYSIHNTCVVCIF